MSYRYRESGERYPKSWWFRTVRHPKLTEIYQDYYTGEGYRTGTKIVPKSVAKDLTPLALAIWIMDDGNYSHGAINISTYSFTLDDIIFLQRILRTNFNAESKYYLDRDKGYRMTFSVHESIKLVNIIHPYIIPTMMYKIGS